MYFYNHKINKYENEQAQLLEMRSNACFHFRNGTGICSINYYVQFF